MNRLLIAVFMVIIIFTSCGNIPTQRNTGSATTFVFDESIPLEESVIVENDQSDRFTVVSVNGTPVEWNKSGAIEMQIPSGNTELIASLHTNTVVGGGFTRSFRVQYSRQGAKLNYNFKAGNKYRIEFSLGWDNSTEWFTVEQYFLVKNLDTNKTEKVQIEFIDSRPEIDKPFSYVIDILDVPGGRIEDNVVLYNGSSDSNIRFNVYVYNFNDWTLYGAGFLKGARDTDTIKSGISDITKYRYFAIESLNGKDYKYQVKENRDDLHITVLDN